MQNDVILVGGRVRVYDYPIKNTARPVYAEGVVTEIIESPFKGFIMLCDLCSYYGREGQKIAVPFQRAIAEFEGRIQTVMD